MKHITLSNNIKLKSKINSNSLIEIECAESGVVIIHSYGNLTIYGS